MNKLKLVYFILKALAKKLRFSKNFVRGIVQFNKSRNLKTFVKENEVAMLKEELLEFIDARVDSLKTGESVDHLEVDALSDLCVVAMGAIHKKGYDINIVMQETLKEITSRRGALNTATGKWEKDKNQPAETLYKANYEKARYKKGPKLWRTLF